MPLSRSRLSQLCQARERLCEDVDDAALSVASLAEGFGLSTGLFIREFARLFGETPHQMRIRSRLERAQRLLARGESVTGVCFEIGFSSVGSFSALFHRRVGLTPSEYGAQARRLAQVPGELRRALSPGCLELMAAAWDVQFRRSRLPAGMATSRS
jgi:AraC-like DNA-binding protein